MIKQKKYYNSFTTHLFIFIFIIYFIFIYISGSSYDSVMGMVDLLGISRDSLNTKFINFFKDELLAMIPKLSQQQLDNLLEASFTYTYIKELQPIIFSVIIQNKNIPPEYLINMSTPAVYSMCPIEVKRKIWVADPKSFYTEVDPLISAYFAEYVHSLTPAMLLNKAQAEDESAGPLPPYALYQFDWLTRYTREPSLRPPSVYKIKELVGSSPEVYTLVLERLQEQLMLAEEAADPRYCALRCDIAAVVQESKVVSINKPSIDLCYPIISILETVVSDGKTKPEFLKTLDLYITKSANVLGERTLMNLAMIFAAPHYANILFYNLVELVQLIYRNKRMQHKTPVGANGQQQQQQQQQHNGSHLQTPNIEQKSNLTQHHNQQSPNSKMKTQKSKSSKNFRESTKAKVAKHEAMVAAKAAISAVSSSTTTTTPNDKAIEELEKEEASKIDPQNAPALLTLVKALDYAARLKSDEKSGVLDALKLIHNIVDEENSPQMDWMLLEKSVLCRRIFLCHIAMLVFGSMEVPEAVDEIVNLSSRALTVEPAFSRSMITALLKKRRPTDKNKPLAFRTAIFNALLPRRDVFVVRSQLFRYLSLMVPNGKLPDIVPLLEKVVAPLPPPVDEEEAAARKENMRYHYDSLVLAANWRHFSKAVTTKLENDKTIEAPPELLSLIKAVDNGNVLTLESASGFNFSSVPASSPCPPDIEEFINDK